MTVLDEGTRASADEQTEALFKGGPTPKKEALGITIIVVCVPIVVGVLSLNAGSRGDRRSGGSAASSERLPRVLTGPAFNQSSNVPRRG